jgi:hypothetical protein
MWEKHEGVPLPKEGDAPSAANPGRNGGNTPVISKMVALMLADDLVGVAESQQDLQQMADTIHAYSRKCVAV